jgi:glycosyltransferase involved in cell wall biosynthesis
MSESFVKVSIVIPTYNRRFSLARTLESIVSQDFPATEYEVIVVADGCTDSTEEYLQRFRPACGFRWLSQANLGAAAAQNAGVAAAAGDLIIFVDDDCICDSGLVASHVEAHRDSDRVVAIGPMLLHADTRPRERCAM